MRGNQSFKILQVSDEKRKITTYVIKVFIKAIWSNDAIFPSVNFISPKIHKVFKQVRKKS